MTDFGPIEDSKEFAPAIAGPVTPLAQSVQPVAVSQLVAGEGSPTPITVQDVSDLDYAIFYMFEFVG